MTNTQKQKLETLKRKADALKNVGEPEQQEYYAGLYRGLLRAEHGEKFGTPEEHAVWSNREKCYSVSLHEAARARGYADGAAFPAKAEFGVKSLYNRPNLHDESALATAEQLQAASGFLNKKAIAVEIGMNLDRLLRVIRGASPSAPLLLHERYAITEALQRRGITLR